MRRVVPAAQPCVRNAPRNAESARVMISPSVSPLCLAYARSARRVLTGNLERDRDRCLRDRDGTFECGGLLEITVGLAP